MASGRSFWNHSSFSGYIGLLVLLFIIGAIFFGASWMYGQQPKAPATAATSSFFDPNTFVNQVNAAVNAQASSLPEGLRGELANSRLYLTLSNKGSIYTRPYVFEKGILSAANDEEAQPDYIALSPDGSKMAVFAVSPGRKDLSVGWHIKAESYVYDTQGLSAAYPPATLDEKNVVSKEGVSLKQQLAVSNNGDVLFIGWDGNEMPGVAPASDWSIYYSDGSGAERIINGYAPKWISDTQFVFLKNDGVYLGNAITHKEALLAPSEALVSSNSSLDVSDDGNTVVWSNPNKNEIHVYDVTSDMDLTLRGTLSARTFWLAISPSGNYLAAETVRPDASGSETNAMPSVQFFDLASVSPVVGYSIPLDLFEANHINLHEWGRIQ